MWSWPRRAAGLSSRYVGRRRRSRRLAEAVTRHYPAYRLDQVIRVLRALVDASTHRLLLDSFAGLEKDVAALETLWDVRRAAYAALDEHRAGMERAAREADYLRHSSDELRKLKPKDGEETELAGRRTTMMQGEKIAGDLREAQDAVSGNHSPVAALAAAVRRLERRAGNLPALDPD